MSLPPNMHWIAAMAFERMLYCLTGGMALGVVIWAVLRLLPGKNSRTRFTVWFSTLLAVALMPMLAFGPARRLPQPGVSSISSHALVSISSAWAEYIVAAWSAVALFGLVRVAAGVWQLHRLRRGCVPVDPNLLSSASLARITDPSKRHVSLFVSSDVEVPTAIGFIHPAIVIPVWMTEDSAATELEYVLLHELAHLERWDDWSNLAQKLIKAVLFFHPAVWWIERRLSLDREMACDDTVLEQSTSPRLYAECLTRIAEKRFLQRQLALAQAAVDRVKQLSRRVARILDADRIQSTRLWKPAVPLVLGAAAICAVSTVQTPELVRVTEPRPTAAASASNGIQIPLIKARGADAVASEPSVAETGAARMISARATEPSAKMNKSRSPLLPAKHHLPRRKPDPQLRAGNGAPSAPVSLFAFAKFDPASLNRASVEATEDEQVPAGAIVMIVATQRTVSNSAGTWQFNTWELRMLVPASHPVKPVPRKT